MQVRSMAAVLLRRIYTSSFEEFWPQFPPESQAQLKERTIVSIQGEPNAALRKKICECGAEFARNLLGEYRRTIVADFKCYGHKPVYTETDTASLFCIISVMFPFCVLSISCDLLSVVLTIMIFVIVRDCGISTNAVKRVRLKFWITVTQVRIWKF